MAPCALFLRPKMGEIIGKPLPFAGDEVLRVLLEEFELCVQLAFTDEIVGVEPLDGITFGQTEGMVSSCARAFGGVVLEDDLEVGMLSLEFPDDAVRFVFAVVVDDDDFFNAFQSLLNATSQGLANEFSGVVRRNEDGNFHEKASLTSCIQDFPEAFLSRNVSLMLFRLNE